ncbi:MAG TPA: holo-ACP synthase, partial [Acidimicrobiales bacterium]
MTRFVGIGTDLVDLDRFRAVLERRPSIKDRVFTEAERAYAEQRHDPVERYAVRFAAKEAVLKALGVGLGAAALHEIEVRRDGEGRPTVALTGTAADLAAAAGVGEWRLTLTHDTSMAQAIAVALGPDLPPPAPPLPPSVGIDPLIAGGLVPIVTPEEMGAIDRAAPEPVEVLIGRAGGAVARAARRMLGGTYGRRVVVIAGKGNNGNDGRDAARRLEASGVRVRVIDAADAPARLPHADLVIDAAYGTGFRGSFRAPEVGPDVPVLAVDIPSGVDGMTGQPSDRVLAADVTVTFAALKPGLLLPPGSRLAGAVEVADIGLDVSSASVHLVGAGAVADWLPARAAVAHKWQTAVWIVAGSPGMGGAAALCASAAARAGAGYVRLSTPGGEAADLPVEVVRLDLPATDWAAEVLDGLDRFSALVVGNGLGTEPSTREAVRAVVAGAAERGIPTVVDA